MTVPWQAFREQLLTALDQVDPARFEYIDRDTVLGACPSCHAAPPAYVAVTFVGTTSTADLYCSAGCTPHQLAYAFDLPIVGRMTTEEMLAILHRRRDQQLAAAGIGDYTTPFGL